MKPLCGENSHTRIHIHTQSVDKYTRARTFRGVHTFVRMYWCAEADSFMKSFGSRDETGCTCLCVLVFVRSCPHVCVGVDLGMGYV